VRGWSEGDPALDSTQPAAGLLSFVIIHPYIHHPPTKPQSKTASNKLAEARGFSSTIPTTQLIKGKPKGQQQPGRSAVGGASTSRQQPQPSSGKGGLIGGSR